MKTTTKFIFVSALMLEAAAPTLSHAAYFVDQTITTPTPAMDKKIRVDRALDAMAYVPADSNRGNEYLQKGGILNQH